MVLGKLNEIIKVKAFHGLWDPIHTLTSVHIHSARSQKLIHINKTNQKLVRYADYVSTNMLYNQFFSLAGASC